MIKSNSLFATSSRVLRRYSAGLVLGCACALGLGAAQAADFSASRIGFVNIDRVLQESAALKASYSQLEKEFAPRQKDLTAQETSFREAVTKFQTDAPVMAESKRLEQQKKLQEQDRSLQQLANSLNQDFNKRRNEELGKVVAEVNKVLQQIAKTEKLDFVLSNAAFVDTKNDLTERVIKQLQSPSAK